MIANYHTHTARCNHAAGEDEEYVLKAITEDVRILGFSDHGPNIYNEEYTSYYKMRPDELPEYCASIAKLQEKYQGKIELHAGLEVEFFPELWDRSFKLWSHSPIEYLIIGQHYIDYEISGGIHGDHTHRSRKFPNIEHTSRERLRRYVDRVIEGISTDVFTYIAHPDLITFTGDDDIYREEMYRLIRASQKYGTPLEYNLLGMHEDRGYPCDIFWHLAAELGSPAILGCDAHAPAELANQADIKRAEEHLHSLGIKILDTVELRNPFKQK